MEERAGLVTMKGNPVMLIGNEVRIGQKAPDAELVANLPFAQSRWCGAAGVKNVRTLSDHREASLGKAYGVLIKDARRSL